MSIYDKKEYDRIMHLLSFPQHATEDDLKLLIEYCKKPCWPDTILQIMQSLPRDVFFKIFAYVDCIETQVYNRILRDGLKQFIYDIKKEEFEMLHSDGKQTTKNFCIQQAICLLATRYIELYKEYYLSDYQTSLSCVYPDTSKECINFINSERRKYGLGERPF